MKPRKWHRGPPPHIGWWNASNAKVAWKWRWWNGEYWSVAADDWDNAREAGRCAAFRAPDYGKAICWTDYYPANARVRRVKP